MSFRSVLASSLLPLLLAVPIAHAGQDKPDAKPTPLEVAKVEREKPVSYLLEVSEILFDKCIGCHSSALAENELNLEEFGGLMTGGKSGPAIVPGKADESLLFLLAAHRKAPVMPPKDEPNATPMTPEELGLLKTWIDAGAKDDTEAMLAEMEADESKNKAPVLGSLPASVQPIVAVDVTEDGRLVAAGRANVISIYEVATGKEIARLNGHKDIIQSLRFSPDGRRLASGGFQVVKLWQAPEDESATEGETKGDEVPGGRIGHQRLGPGPRIDAPRVSRADARLQPGRETPRHRGRRPVEERRSQGLGPLHGRDRPRPARVALRHRVQRPFQPGRVEARDGLRRQVRQGPQPSRRRGRGVVRGPYPPCDGGGLEVGWLATGQRWGGQRPEDLGRRQGRAGPYHAARRQADHGATLDTGTERPSSGASGDHSVRTWNPDDGRIGRTFNGPGDFVFSVGTSRDGKVIAAGGADGVLFVWDDQGKVLQKFEPPVPEDGASSTSADD